MTHIVTEKCIKCKYTDCVDVCPVECFYEGPNMLVIHPEECIDCGVCIAECPVDAIITDDGIDSNDAMLKLNEKYSLIWPNIVAKKDPPKDADDWAKIDDKVKEFEDY